MSKISQFSAVNNLASSFKKFSSSSLLLKNSAISALLNSSFISDLNLNNVLSTSTVLCTFASLKSIELISSSVNPISFNLDFVFGIVVSSKTLSKILLALYSLFVSTLTSGAQTGSAKETSLCLTSGLT